MLQLAVGGKPHSIVGLVPPPEKSKKKTNTSKLHGHVDRNSSSDQEDVARDIIQEPKYWGDNKESEDRGRNIFFSIEPFKFLIV